MTHPLASLNVNQRRATFIVLLLFTLGAMFALNGLGEALRTNAAPAGIISYEFAGDVPGAKAILDSWDNRAEVLAGFNLGLDYLFLTTYSTTIAMAILWVASRLNFTGRRLWLTTLMAWGLWLAALLDSVENAALFNMLVNGASDPWPGLAWWCALFKFALVLVGIAFVLGGTVVSMMLSLPFSSEAQQ